MPAQYPIELQFPLGGVHRRLAYQAQPPFTTPEARNVLPDDMKEGRARGGSRPGWVAEHTATAGAAWTVQGTNATPVVPTSLYGALMAYNPNENVIVFWNTSGTYHCDSAGNWTAPAVTNPPPTGLVVDAHLFWDSAVGQIGAVFMQFNGDVDYWWYLVGTTTWMKAKTTAGKALTQAGLCFDPSRSSALIWGGVKVVGGATTTEVLLSSPSMGTYLIGYAPEDLRRSRGVYDAENNRIIVFGGMNGGYSQKMLAYDLSAYTWSYLTPPSVPPGRYQQAMAFDTATKRLILAGGIGSDGSGGSEWLLDTWQWDGDTWRQIPASANGHWRNPHLVYESGSTRIHMRSATVGASGYRDELLGTGTGLTDKPVRMLAVVPFVENDGVDLWRDEFEGDGAMGASWVTPRWLASREMPVCEDGRAVVEAGVEAGAVLDNTLLDAATEYVVEMLIRPDDLAYGGTFRVLAAMSTTTPDITVDGVIAEMVIAANGSYTSAFKSIVAGVVTTNAGSSGSTDNMPGWLRLEYRGGKFYVYFRGTNLYTSGALAPAGRRCGLVLIGSANRCVVDAFLAQNLHGGKAALRTATVLSAGGKAYIERTVGAWEEISTADCTLSQDRLLQAAYAIDPAAVYSAQRLYVADNGIIVYGDNGTLAKSGSDILFDSASYANWSTTQVKEGDWLIISSAAAANEFYRIGSVAVGSLTLATYPPVPDPGAGRSNLQFRIVRSLRVIRPAAEAPNPILTYHPDVSGKGYTPPECPLVAAWNGRLIVGGPPYAPHWWAMSRAGTYTDWDFTREDAAAAIDGTNALVSGLGEPLRAIVPYRDDYVLFLHRNSVWVMRGDPRAGGRLDNLSRRVGCVHFGAACMTPDGWCIFLSEDGLYGIAPGALMEPQPISRPTLPRELLDVDPQRFVALVAWDPQRMGIAVFVSPLTAAGFSSNWFLHWESRSWWQVTLPDNVQPTALVSDYSEFYGRHMLLTGGRDGQVRGQRRQNSADDSVPIDSSVVYGPVRLGIDAFSVGLLQQIDVTLSEDSGNVTVDILTGDTPETALAADPAYTFTAGPGLNVRHYPRKRGNSLFVRLSGADGQWAVESIEVILEKYGRRRRLV